MPRVIRSIDTAQYWLSYSKVAMGLMFNGLITNGWFQFEEMKTCADRQWQAMAVQYCECTYCHGFVHSEMAKGGWGCSSVSTMLPSMQDFLGSIPSIVDTWSWVHICNPSTWEVEGRGWEVASLSQLYN